ncbi:hypothetical protein PoB_005916500, partial [Plakobranchus ocellatus]
MASNSSNLRVNFDRYKITFSAKSRPFSYILWKRQTLDMSEDAKIRCGCDFHRKQKILRTRQQGRGSEMEE